MPPAAGCRGSLSGLCVAMQGGGSTPVSAPVGPAEKEACGGAASPVAQKAAPASRAQPRRTVQKSRFFRDSSTVALPPGMLFPAKLEGFSPSDH